MKKRLKTLIDFYGLTNQLKKLNEEIYELEEAILLDDKSEKSLKHILEERADVEVLLRQIELFYGIDFEDYAEIMIKKINRQIERIRNENRG